MMYPKLLGNMEANITALLAKVHGGNKQAREQLALVVYDQLHHLAARCMNGERPNHSLQATILVHEAFVRLVHEADRNWQNRSHFFAVAAQVMRRLLIDHARASRAARRDKRLNVNWDDALVASEDSIGDWIFVDEALTRLSSHDARLSQIVELRFFAGFTEEEIARVLGVAPRTVRREWRVAKARLRGELSGAGAYDVGAVAESQRSNG